jgi:hypothetical protein
MFEFVMMSEDGVWSKYHHQTSPTVNLGWSKTAGG